MSETTSSNSFGASRFSSFCVSTAGFSPICLFAVCGLSCTVRIRFSHLKTSSSLRLFDFGSELSSRLLSTVTQNSRECMYDFFFIFSLKSFRNFSRD